MSIIVTLLIQIAHYINSELLSKAIAPKQVGGTCYANATAMCLFFAMSRVHERDGGVPSFKELREKIIKTYGERGANTENVIASYCKPYRLHYQKTKDEATVKKVIDKQRSLVATFSLSYLEWDNFSDFFRDNPNGVLTTKDLEKKNGRTYFKILTNEHNLYLDEQLTNKSSMKFKANDIIYGKVVNDKIVLLKNGWYCSSEYVELDTNNGKSNGGGHAVVLMRREPKCLVFMNSWGKEWADDGYFRVENLSVLNVKCFDIYWTLNDLTINEKKAWKDYCNKKRKNAINNIKSHANKNQNNIINISNTNKMHTLRIQGSIYNIKFVES